MQVGGALIKLNSEGIKVFRAEAPTVKDEWDILNEGRLLQLSMRQTCGGHGGGCARWTADATPGPLQTRRNALPIYEYRCESCGRINEILVLRKDEELKCGSCGSHALVKLMSAPNIAVAPGGGFSAGALCGGEASPESCGMTSSCGSSGGG